MERSFSFHFNFASRLFLVKLHLMGSLYTPRTIMHNFKQAWACIATPYEKQNILLSWSPVNIQIQRHI